MKLASKNIYIVARSMQKLTFIRNFILSKFTDAMNFARKSAYLQKKLCEGECE